MRNESLKSLTLPSHITGKMCKRKQRIIYIKILCKRLPDQAFGYLAKSQNLLRDIKNRYDKGSHDHLEGIESLENISSIYNLILK